ncbi:MAG: peptidoglycan-binding protein [Clostridia bacterium]|nr:peptidoglycan-binding protein [Clostridia bacterium]
MRIRPVTIILCVLLIGAVAAIALIAPDTMEAKRMLHIEQAATPTPTADVRSMLMITPDPNVTPKPTAFLLKNGVEGDEVKNLQRRLKELGYYSGGVDGQYGPGTQDAVIRFQTQHGLTADGIVGEGTRSAVYAQAAQTFIPTPAPTPTPGLLKKGDDGESVKAMQQRLKELGYYNGSVDGDFGGGTEEAVRLFQSQNGLDVDGVAAKKTFSLLYSEDAKQVTATPTPDPNAMPMLVNRDHPIDESYQPRDLVKLKNVIPSSVATVKGSDIEGDRTAVNAMIEMFKDAHAEGVDDWQISAGYRSYKYQKKLFDNSVQDFRNQGFSQTNAVSATRQTVADPGTSEHHTGLAFDINVPGTIFKGTPEQIWLHKHCWDYGFVIRYQEDKESITGYLAECWHIRYVGLPHSITMRDRNLCLEEYLGVV